MPLFIWAMSGTLLLSLALWFLTNVGLHKDPRAFFTLPYTSIWLAAAANNNRCSLFQTSCFSTAPCLPRSLTHRAVKGFREARTDRDSVVVTSDPGCSTVMSYPLFLCLWAERAGGGLWPNWEMVRRLYLVVSGGTVLKQSGDHVEGYGFPNCITIN